MRRTAVLSLFAIVCLSACGDDDVVPPVDAGDVDAGDVDAGPPRDAGPSTRSISYTPTGCGYTVTSPDVGEALMGGDAVGATPSIDHVHVSWAGPTTSTFAVNWRSDSATMLSQVLYGTDEAAVRVADGAGTGVSVQLGHTMFYSGLADPRGTGTRLHEVHVCGLTPATRYFYKVGGPGHWSDAFDVTTGPALGATAPWSFAVTGDSRSDPMAAAETMSAVDARAPDFQIFSGDTVVLGANQPDWNAFFEAGAGAFTMQDLLAHVPFMPTNGNHEDLAVNFLAQFAMPQQVTTGELAQGEEWYSFDYANAHFAVVNDYPDERVSTEQTEWLRADLMAVDRGTTPWLFVMHHRGLYSSSLHGSNDVARAAWQPVFDAARVDIVFNGHDHNYERSKPMRGFQTGTMDGALVAEGTNGVPMVAESGTMYIVAAGSGAPLYASDTSYFTHLSESTRNYGIVEIEGRTLRFNAYRLDGSMLDSFEYTK